MFQTEFKKMWSNRLTWYAFAAGAVLALVAFWSSVNMVGTSYGQTPENISMLWNSGVGTMMLLFFTPLLATFPAACSYYEETTKKTACLIIVRGTRTCYYWDKLIVVAVSSFLVSCFPFLLNYLFCLLAVSRPDCPPIDSTTYVFGHVYERVFFERLGDVLFPSLFLNHPVWDALLHIFLVGLFGSGIAILAYTISFFFKKNLLLTSAIPAVFVSVLTIIVNEMQWKKWVLALQLDMNPYIGRGKDCIPVTLFLIAVPYLIGAALLCVKLFSARGRDEL